MWLARSLAASLSRNARLTWSSCSSAPRSSFPCSFVLEATIRGVHFHVITCLPPAHPSSRTFAAFGQVAPGVARAPTMGHETALADNIQITSAQHFVDVLAAALAWRK